MKNFYFLTNLFSSAAGRQSNVVRVRDGQQPTNLQLISNLSLTHTPFRLVKWVAVLCLLVTLGVGNAWGVVTVKIADVASANSWTNSSTHTSWSSGIFTFSTSGSYSTTPAYYSSDNTWRIYKNTTVTITPDDGYEILAINSDPNQTWTISSGIASYSKTNNGNIAFKSFSITYKTTTGDACNILDVTGGSDVILPAGSTTYYAQDWWYAGAPIGAYGSGTKAIGADDYCVKFTNVYDDKDANGVLLKASTGVIEIEDITSNYGVDIDILCSSSGGNFTVSLDGADNVSGTNTTLSISTTSTTADLTISKATSNAGRIKYIKISPKAAPAGCSNYSFHYQHSSDWNTDNICFTQVSTSVNYLTDELSLPYAEWYNVTGTGNGGHGASDAYTYGFTGTTDNTPMPFYHYRSKSFGANPQSGNIGGGLGRFHVYGDSDSKNKYVSFIPTYYTLNFGTGDTWTNDSTLVLSPESSDWDETDFYSPITTLSNAAIGRKIFVGLKTTAGYVWCSPYSVKENLSGLRTKSNSGDNWVVGGLTTGYASKRGKFRVYANSGDNNWYITFIPHHRIIYHANYPVGDSPADTYSVDVSVEETNSSISLNSAPSAPTGYTFDGWYTAASGGTKRTGNQTISAGASADTELYAHWNETLHDVTVEYKCGSTSLQDNTTIENVGVTTTGTTTAPASFTGYTWSTWSSMPSGVTTSTTPLTTRTIVINATADSKTITANYTANKYNITYKDQDDEDYSGAVTDGVPTGAPSTHAYGSATALVDGSKDGYTFNGWFTDEDCTEGPVISLGATAYTADITLYAKWTERIAITFNVPTGVTKPSNSYTDVTLPTPSGFPSAVDDECWAFAGWTESSSVNSTSAPATLYPAGSMYSGSQASAFNLYAVYSRNKYLVVYDNDMLTADADYIITSWNGDNYAVVGVADGDDAEVADVGDNVHDKILRGLHYYTLDNPAEKTIWHLTGTTDSYVLQNKATGKYLNVAGSSLISGSSATLSITEGTGEDAQTYKLTGGDNHLVISSSGASVATGDAEYYFLYKLLSSKYMTTPAEPTFTVTWKIAGEEDQTTIVSACDGLTEDDIEEITFPDDDHLELKNGGCVTNGKGKFMGWSTYDLGSESGQSNPGDLFKTYDKAPYLTGDLTVYAVFADGDMTQNAYDLNSSGSLNSNWEKTTTRSAAKNDTYAGKTYTWQVYGSGGTPATLGELNTASTYTNVSGFKLLVASSNATTVKLYYSANKSDWVEASSQSVSANSSSYTEYEFNVSSVPSTAVYLKITNSVNSLYIKTATITTGALSNYRTSCCDKKIAAPSVSASKTAYTVTLSWDDVTSANGNASTYEMQWNGGEWATVTSPVEKTSLTPNTSYSWKVRVKTWTGTYYCGANEASGSTTTNQVYTVTYAANGGTGTMTDANSYEAGDEVTVKANTFTYSGYNWSSWSYSPSVSVTAGKFTMPSSNVTITAQWSTKTLTSISLAEASISVYVGEIKYVDVIYDPSDILTKGFTQVATPSYCQIGTYASNMQAKITGGRAGATITEDKTETVSIKANADIEKTTSITVTVKPLPTVTFVDLIHNKSDFANSGDGWTAGTGVLSSTVTTGVVSHAKKTPTHTDVSAPVGGNACETGHLHLMGWIRSDYPALVAYMNGTGARPEYSAIISAGDDDSDKAYFLAPNASINVEDFNGKTFYAVWATIE